jgi:D-Tyr-tRNAtyr deacylase
MNWQDILKSDFSELDRLERAIFRATDPEVADKLYEEFVDLLRKVNHYNEWINSEEGMEMGTHLRELGVVR